MPNRSETSRFAPLLAAMVIMALGMCLQIGSLALNLGAGAMDFDEAEFHIPAIRQFLRQWPAPDISDYPVAASPGFHLLVAATLAPVGESALDDHLGVVRFGTGLCALVMVALVAWLLARRVSLVDAVLLSLPLLLGQYVFSAAIRITPEALGWLTVAFGLALGVVKGRWTWAVLLSSLVVLAAVFVRQPNLWLASIVWMIAWLGTPADAPHRADRLIPARHTWAIGPRVGRTAIAFLATLPAFALLAWLISIWGGPTPPGFQTIAASDTMHGATAHAGVNLAVPAAMLMTVGVYGLPALLTVAATSGAGLRALWSRPLLVPMLIGAGIALFCALVVPTSFSAADGRWGSLWKLAQLVPAPMDRAPLVVIAAGFGGSVVGAVFSSVDARSRWILLGSFVAFTAAQTANTQAWIRYLEPFALLWLSIGAAQCVRTSHADNASPCCSWLTRTAWLGLAMLMLAQTAVFRLF